MAQTENEIQWVYELWEEIDQICPPKLILITGQPA